MKRKKITAVLLASLLGVSAAPVSAFAADSYTATEKAAYAAAVEKFAAEYAEDLAKYKEAITGNADIKLSIDDAGKQLIGMLAQGLDVSWLNDVSLTTNVSVKDNVMAETMAVNVNGGQICTVEYYFDLENSMVYMRMPELADGYIKMNLQELSNSAESVVASDTSLDVDIDMGDLLSGYTGFLENMPDAAVIQNLLNTYGDVFFNNVTDVESAGTQAVTAGGVSQDLTLLQGRIGANELIAMLKEAVTTAKSDEDLKGIVETVTGMMNDPAYTYDTFVAALDELEGEFEGTEEQQDDGSGFILGAWVDANGEVVGHQFDFTDGTSTYTISSVSTADGDNRGYALQALLDGESFALEGSGQMSGDLLSGNYVLNVSGEDTVQIDVQNYDPAAAEEGMWKGVYTISAVPVVDSEGNSYDPLNGFQLQITADAQDKDSVSLGVGVLSSGVSLGAITLSSSNAGDAIEIPDLASLDNVYDLNSDEDGTRFENEMTLDNIMNNMTAAGVPDGFLETLINAASGNGADTVDGTVNEETDMAGDTLDETPAA